MAVSSIGAASSNAVGGSALEDPGTLNYSSIAIGSTARSGIKVDADTYLYENKNSVFTQDDQWLKWGDPGDYEVRFTFVSGTRDFGAAAGVWLVLSVDREIGIQTETVETDTAEVTVEIRRVAATGDIITFTCNLSAQQDFPV